MTQEAIDALARDYAPILHGEASYDWKCGYITSELITLEACEGQTLNSVSLYAGYIVAAALRSKPAGPNIDDVIRGLI